MTTDILNYLGVASKMYIDTLRQELRVSIALHRNPTLNDSKDQRVLLEKNIRET